MNIFLTGVEKGDKATKNNEIIYSNIASLVVSFAALLIFLILLDGYGWMTPVYITLGVVIVSNLTLLLNYLGYTIISRLFLSLLPPIAILSGDLMTLTYIPDGTHAYSFDVRVLILATVVLPLLLFTMKERVYMGIALVSNGLILFFFNQIHTLFGINLSNAFGNQYYISTLFFVLAFSFIVTTLQIFKIRLRNLNKANKELLFGLEEKVAERTLDLKKNTEELVRHNNELEQFSFAVSHNVRGPIARLLGLTDLFNKLDEAEHRTIIKQIRLTTVSLDTVISDLNAILQVRNNLYSVKEYVDVSEEIKIAQQLLSGVDKEICCSENMELNIGENKVFGVRAFIQSIMYNLIGNAFKYKRARVDLKVKVSTELNGENILLKIADNGRGIDLNKFGDKVFKMYSRFDLETQGKGLGLYLVKQQVEAMNGTINIESMPNQGTTFSIVLPIPDASKITHQVYYDDSVVSFIYNGTLNASLVFWKKHPSSEDFRQTITNNIKNLSMYTTNFWINDTTNFGSLSAENQKWFNEKAIPAVLDSGIKGIIIVNKEGKGFKSSQWDLLKSICSLKGIMLAFKFDIEEANTFILSISKENQVEKVY